MSILLWSIFHHFPIKKKQVLDFYIFLEAYSIRILGILYLFESYFIYILCFYCNGTYLTFPLVYVVIEHIPSFFLGLYHHFLAIYRSISMWSMFNFSPSLLRCGVYSTLIRGLYFNEVYLMTWTFQVYIVIQYSLSESRVYVVLQYVLPIFQVYMCMYVDMECILSVSQVYIVME